MASQKGEPTSPKRLEILDRSQPHTFIKPAKKINEGHDVPHFLISQAYRDIIIFVMQLNRAMCPRTLLTSHKDGDGEGSKKKSSRVQIWELDAGSKEIAVSGMIARLREMLRRIESIIEEAPPDTGPRRFGNVSFRRWHEMLEARAEGILDEFLPEDVLYRSGDGDEKPSSSGDRARSKDELLSYLLGGFGSSQRLDYGTGHELSFMAFLGCVWKLGGFREEGVGEGVVERGIVVNVVEPYLNVIRRLILTYTLEPAGTHGVWGLDDHFFMPYIFGSAQYCPAISEDESMPVEGSLPDSPSPAEITKKETVEGYRSTNMYFSAVGFINDVKTGPFWEHSPILFDISGVQKGWGKINKGMLKMFDAEVLGKFPVVQHFRFGSLFSWDRDPNASEASATTHMSNQLSSHSISVTGNDSGAPTTRSPQDSTKAPWASASLASRPAQEGMRAPWATPNIPSSSQPGATAASWATPSSAAPLPGGMPPPTRAPWANASSSTGPLPPTQAPWANMKPSGTGPLPPTQAPWANTKASTSSAFPPTKAPWASGAGSEKH